VHAVIGGDGLWGCCLLAGPLCSCYMKRVGICRPCVLVLLGRTPACCCICEALQCLPCSHAKLLLSLQE
jgi:hypothetical protein